MIEARYAQNGRLVEERGMYQVDISLREVESYLFEVETRFRQYEIWFTLDDRHGRVRDLTPEQIVVSRVHDCHAGVDLDVSGLAARRIIKSNMPDLLGQVDDIIDAVRSVC